MCVAINNTLRSVFPSVFIYQIYMPSFGSMWGLALAGSDLDPLAVSGDEVDKQIAIRISRKLKFYDGLAHQGIGAAGTMLLD